MNLRHGVVSIVALFTIGAVGEVVLFAEPAVLVDGARASVPAVRGERVPGPPLPPVPVPPTTIPAGVLGLPYAPPGLSACDNAEFYRVQWGLPTVFRRIVYNESRCRNEETVHTFCCWSRYQLWVSLHLRDHRIAPRYAECGITSRRSVDSNTEADKQRAACGARALYDIDGTDPWSATR